MKKFNEFINESLRDKMVGKSEDDVMDKLMKLTPHAMQWKLGDLDLDLDNEYEKQLRDIAEERIEDAEEDLESIFEIYVDTDNQVKTSELFDRVITWVDRNGGNKENLIQYGIKDFAEQIQDSFIAQNRHDWEQLYSYDSIFLFQKLLKQLAKDEVSYNNVDIKKEIWD